MYVLADKLFSFFCLFFVFWFFLVFFFFFGSNYIISEHGGTLEEQSPALSHTWALLTGEPGESECLCVSLLDSMLSACTLLKLSLK